MTTNFRAPPADVQIYDPAMSAAFGKTKEKYGGLSNMASGYPLVIEDVAVLSSEALYQACRFPDNPEVQQLILDQHSPMTAKMVSKPHRDETREYWEEIQVEIMAWCLRVKLLHNWEKFGGVLAETGAKQIVEKSRRDRFWGAVPSPEDGMLHGVNMLGKLLMDLRQQVRRGEFRRTTALPAPNIPDFRLLGRPIGPVTQRDAVGQQRL